MTSFAFAIICVGAALAAVYNIVTKKVLTETWKPRLSAFTFFAHGTAGLLFLAVTAASGGPRIEEGFWLPSIGSGLLNIVLQLGLMKARALEDVSLVTPITSTTPALVIFTSMVILGEYPTVFGWIGIWVMVLGTYSLNIEEARVALEKRMKTKGGESYLKRTALIWLAPFLALGKSVGVRWAFFAALLGTISMNYDGASARHANVAFSCAIIFGISAVGNGVIALVRKEYRGIVWQGATIRAVVIPGALFVAYNYMINTAYREAIVPYVGTLKRLQIPLTIIMAYVFLHEKKSFRPRLFGGILIMVGAFILALQ